MTRRGVLVMLLSIFWPFGARATDKREWQEAEAVLRVTLKPTGQVKKPVSYVTGKFGPKIKKTADGFDTRICAFEPDHPEPPPGISAYYPAPTGDRTLNCWTLSLSRSQPALWTHAIQKVKR